MPQISGMPTALQRALIGLLTLVLLLPRLDRDVERRAQWLKWKLEGFDPAAQLAAAAIDVPLRRVA
jgi:hypothetical protein